MNEYLLPQLYPPDPYPAQATTEADQFIVDYLEQIVRDILTGVDVVVTVNRYPFVDCPPDRMYEKVEINRPRPK